MTRTVSISITVEIAGRSKDVIHEEIHPDQIGDNLKKVTDQVFRSAGTGVITYLDEYIRIHEAKGLKVLGTETREFTTIAGKLSYTRRIYRSKEGKRIKPVDELLGLEKYARRDKKLQEMNCALAGRSNYRETAAISTMITQKYISPASISRDVKRVGLRLAESDKNFYTEEKGTVRSNVLYGESDGIFVRLQKDKEGKKAAEIRAAVTYTGKKWLSGNRRKLTDKMILTAMDVSSLQWQEMVRNHMFAKYDLSNVKLMAVGGDGGSWVGSSFNLCGIKHIEHILDPFHIKRAIRTAFSDALELSPVYDSLFHDGFSAIADTLRPLTKKGRPSIRSARLNCLRYLQNHQDEILPLSERNLPFDRLYSLGCMESNIGKAIALRMKTRGCSWSRSGAQAMSAILCHLPDLFDHSFHYCDFKKLNDFSISSRRHRRFPQPQTQIHTASFPIVSSGKASVPYFSLFKGIINGNELP